MRLMKLRTAILTIVAVVASATAGISQDSPAPAPSPSLSIEQKLAALEKRVEKLEAALQTQSGTDTQTSENFTIYGEVVQRTTEGSLVACKAISRKSDTRKRAKGTIWVTGLKAREGATVNGVGTSSGTYSYVTVAEAERVVDAFEWISGATDL